jgi:hypothetical protein
MLTFRDTRNSNRESQHAAGGTRHSVRNTTMVPCDASGAGARHAQHNNIAHARAPPLEMMVVVCALPVCVTRLRLLVYTPQRPRSCLDLLSPNNARCLAAAATHLVHVPLVAALALGTPRTLARAQLPGTNLVA